MFINKQQSFTSAKDVASFNDQMRRERSILAEQYKASLNSETPESEKLEILINIIKQSNDKNYEWRQEDLKSSRRESIKSTISLVLTAIAALGVIVPFVARALNYF